MPVWPSTEAQEERNAYVDWQLRQRDDYEDAREEKEERERMYMQHKYHRSQESRDLPGFCFVCGVNMGIHPPNNPPANRKATK